MEDLTTKTQSLKVAGMCLGLICCLFGVVVANVSAAWTLLAIACVSLVLIFQFTQHVCSLIIAVVLLFSCSANFVVVAHYDEDARAGCSFILMGMWLAFLCLCSEDLRTHLDQFRGLYRTLCIIALFFNFLGVFMLWGSVPKVGPIALACGVTACLSGIVFFLASTSQSEVWVWVAVFWSGYFQFTLLDMAVSVCDDVGVCSAGGVLAWLGHVGFVGLLAVSFDVPEKERSKVILGCVVLCGVMIAVGAGLAGGMSPHINLANSYAVFSIACLVWSQYSTEGLGNSLVTVAASYMLSVSGVLAVAARLANHVVEGRVAAGCALSLTMLWLAHVLFHMTPKEWAIANLRTDMHKVAVVAAFGFNLLGLIFWWIRLGPSVSPSLATSVNALLSSVFVLDTVVLRPEKLMKHIWLSLLFATQTLVGAMTVVSSSGGEGPGVRGLGQVGSALVWLAHMVFVAVLCVGSLEPPVTQDVEQPLAQPGHTSYDAHPPYDAHPVASDDPQNSSYQAPPQN